MSVARSSSYTGSGPSSPALRSKASSSSKRTTGPSKTEASFACCASSSTKASTDSEWSRMYSHSAALFVG